MTPPTSPIAAVKLLREALEECLATYRATNRPPETTMKAEAQIDRIGKANAKAVEALRLTASIEQPTGEPIGYISDGVIAHALAKGFGASTYIQAGQSTKEFPIAIYAAPPADPTDAQKLATLRDGLAKFGWCSNFGELAQKVLFPPAGATSEPAGAPVDERAAYTEWVCRRLNVKVAKGLTLKNSDGSFQVSSIEHDFRTWEAARAALQQPGQADGWISVEDRLPEWAARDDTQCVIDGRAVPPTLFSQTVLVCLDSGAVRTDKMIAIEGSPPWFDTYRKRVTHWQPTPAAPPPQEKP